MYCLFRLIVLTLTLLLIQSRAFSKEIMLSQLSGARIDANWFRYTNLRFGAAIDIPSQGYRYEVPESDRNRHMEDGFQLVTYRANPMNLRQHEYTLTDKGRALLHRITRQFK